jgi:AAA ATPase domain
VAVEQRLTREKGKHTMRHIDEFTIQAFRGLRDVKFEGLGQVNLLVGENNSGKTSVLEAISLFCNPLEARKWLGLIDPYDSLSNQISWIFPKYRSKKDSEILLSAVGDIPLKMVSATYERFSEIHTDNSPSAFNSEGGNRLLPYPETSGIRINLSILMMSQQDQRSSPGEENLSATLVFYDDRPHSVDKQQVQAFPAQTISPIEHRFSELAPRLWSEVVEADLKKETIKLLCLFDPSIEDVDIISPMRRQAVVVVRHKKLGHPPLSTFGDGLLRVFTKGSGSLHCECASARYV